MSARLLCPHCGSSSHRRPDNSKYRPRLLHNVNVLVRMHVCSACGRLWPSQEEPMYPDTIEATLDREGVIS